MNKEKYILVTGGTGFIGSHVVVELLKAEYNVIIIDNLSNSDIETFQKIGEITEMDPDNDSDDFRFKIKTTSGIFKYLIFHKIDIEKEPSILNKLFSDYKEQIQTVIHLAGLKSVNESTQFPIKYYQCNLTGTLNLLAIMEKWDCKNLVFSSSATVYGNQESPVDETMEIGYGITHPYGRTKFMIEEILKDLKASDDEWNIISLRYFNPIGAHPSSKIGEDPTGYPNNLMPVLLRVAAKIPGYEFLNIFGSDYPTIDGTGVRDYIHVMDLAEGHTLSVEKILESNLERYMAINLGTECGTSVLQLIDSFEKINNIQVDHKFSERRQGDLASVFANNSYAKEILNWYPKLNISDMCRDSWNFFIKSKMGEESKEK